MKKATAPYKTTIKTTRNKVVKEAHYKQVDTGKKQVVTIIDENDEQTEEIRPIYQKVFIEAVIEKIEKDETRWVVETCYKDVTEKHEWKTKKEAEEFYNRIK